MKEEIRKITKMILNSHETIFKMTKILQMCTDVAK